MIGDLGSPLTYTLCPKPITFFLCLNISFNLASAYSIVFKGSKKSIAASFAPPCKLPLKAPEIRKMIKEITDS
jgi:hypothetical protein